MDQARIPGPKRGLKAPAKPSILLTQKMFRTAFILSVAALASLPARGQEESPKGLAGSIDGNLYTSPTGAFTIEIPVLPALGGVIRDTPNVVTFHDGFGLQLTVGAFAQDATLRWELSTRGTKDYLIYFFGSYVLPDLKRFCPATSIQSAGYSADLEEGTLFTYILMPGGSMFADHIVFGKPSDPPVAKRGNAVFVRNGFTIVISTELSERITEGSHYSKTVEEENQILRTRMLAVVRKMQFPKPPAPK